METLDLCFVERIIADPPSRAKYSPDRKTFPGAVLLTLISYPSPITNICDKRLPDTRQARYSLLNQMIVF